MKSTMVGSSFFLAASVNAQEFNVKYIPDSLINNASVVKRYEEIILEIKSPGKYSSHERHVYTILDEAADDQSTYRSYYDHFTTIDYASGVLYDEKGKEIKHVKKKDMLDFADVDESTLIEDGRHIRNEFLWRKYPYTVDYEEDDTKDGVLQFPDWSPIDQDKMSVQYSKYVIKAPDDYVVRYKELNFNIPPTITEKNGKKTYVWEIKNIPAIASTVFAPNWLEIFPYMIVAPSDFEAEGYSGNMSNWKNYGVFLNTLTKGRDLLPEDVKKKVHELTDHLNDPKQKISVLYDFLQTNTHYISIQLGIGGLQPFDATYVATKKYGDCKALSNFMVALLKEAGITGKAVAIKAGDNASPIVTDFSEHQFNHVICCVPLQADTVWLECTSTYQPPGYLGGFTANRWGLLFDETGGTLVQTPKYGFRDNVEVRRIMGTVDKDGNLAASDETTFKAMQQDYLSLLLSDGSNESSMKYLKNSIDLATYDINNLKFIQNKNLLPSITAAFNLTAPNYAQVTGKRIFINPNILNKSEVRLTEDEDRKYEVDLRNDETDIDTVEIEIPIGYKVESPFQDINIQSKFGTFVASAVVTLGKISYYRKEEYFSGRFPATDYANLLAYYQQVYKSDHTKIVLVMNE